MGTLLSTPRTLDGPVLVTGGGGYVGTLTVAALLADGVESVLVPLRDAARETEMREAFALELSALASDPARADRVGFIRMPPIPELDVASLVRSFRDGGVQELVHCAGCVDYYDEAALQLVNVDFTRLLAEAAGTAGVRRFTYVSTAYAGGYRDDCISETLLDEPESDPTPYTRSKRQAEHVLAASGVPWLILRPSILIGDARQGRYSGKRYGLYQQWMGLERLMCNKYHADIHTVAPEAPLNLLHQDAWQQALIACLRHVPDASVVNVVSASEACPSMRHLWKMWAEVVQPERVHFYPRFEDVDLKAIDLRQRAYLSFAQVNLEIGAHHWRFQRDWLAMLEAAEALRFEHATEMSVRMCQDRFVSASDLIQKYRERHHASLAPNPQFITTRKQANAVAN